MSKILYLRTSADDSLGDWNCCG